MDDAAVPATRVESLRERIHTMRKNIILGGDQVRAAESEAVDFYNRKMEAVESRRDSIHAELAEAEASYEVALGRALKAGSPDARQTAMMTAGEIRTRIETLKSESSSLAKRREGLANLAGAVESREAERERLALRMESMTGVDDDLGFPFGGLGLAAPEIDSGPPSPFDDQRLVQDLLSRQPVEARRVLFEADPVRYWERFSLQPPIAPLQESLTFPTPDPPGYR